MDAEYWNKYYGGRRLYARPVREGDKVAWLVPVDAADGTPLPQDFIETAGEIGFSISLEEMD